MNKFKGYLIVLISLSIFFSCKDVKNKTNGESVDETTKISSSNSIYNIDIKNSTIKWKAFSPAGGHNGTIKLSEGKVGIENGQVKVGNFTIDMNSITVSDVKDKKDNDELVNHLKDPDFFNVPKFSKGVFEITGITAKDNKMSVKGNLTLKDITKSIEIPVIINENNEILSIVSEPINIDRTEWGITYNSGKFFKDLKDYLIKDNIEIAFDLKGNLKQ